MLVPLVFLLNRCASLNYSMRLKVRYDSSDRSFQNFNTHCNLINFEELQELQDDPLYLSWDFCTAWHDYGTVSFCSSKKITADVLLTKYFNSEALERYCELPSHWWLQLVKISTSSGTVSGQICWFVVKLWLTDCCDCFFCDKKWSRGQLAWKGQ